MLVATALVIDRGFSAPSTSGLNPGFVDIATGPGQPDTNAPTLISVTADCDTNQVSVTFSEPVDPASALDLSSYAIDQGVFVQSIALSSDLKTAILDVVSILPCVSYQLAIFGITDLAGNPINPDPMVVAFQCMAQSRPPVITVQPVSVLACPGTKVVLSSTMTGAAPLNLQWYSNSAAIPGANASTYSVANVTAAEAGAYYLVAANACGVTVSSNAVVALRTPVTATGPADRIVCAGRATTFASIPTGTGPFAYRWTKSGANIPNETNATLKNQFRDHQQRRQLLRCDHRDV